MDPKKFRDRRHRELARSQQTAEARIVSPPERAALKHGLRLKHGAMSCQKCICRDGHCGYYQEDAVCQLETEYMPARYEEMGAALVASGHDAVLHRALIERAVFAEVRWGRAVRYLAVLGELKEEEGGDSVYRDVAKEFSRVEAAMERALAALNLTPAAEARLAASRSDALKPLAAAILEVDAERQRVKAAIVEGEFTTEDAPEGDASEPGVSTPAEDVETRPGPAGGAGQDDGE